MTAHGNARIERARRVVREGGLGNLGYIGRLEAEIESMEAELIDREAALVRAHDRLDTGGGHDADTLEDRHRRQARLHDQLPSPIDPSTTEGR